MNRWIWLAGLLRACCVLQHMCDASCTPGPAVQARLRRTPSAVGPSCLRVGRRRAAGSESCGMAQGTAEAEAEGQTPPLRSRFVGFSSAWVRSKTKTVDSNSNCTTKSNSSMKSGAGGLVVVWVRDCEKKYFNSGQGRSWGFRGSGQGIRVGPSKE